MKILVLLFILVWVASALDVDTALAESLRFDGPSTQDGLCAELGARMGLGSVSASAAPWPRIFDAFLVGDDLEMLEIRLYELHTVVDFFVIAESNTTFTHREKAIMYRDVRERFRRFWHQIVYVAVDEFAGDPNAADAHWMREHAMRTALLQQGAEKMRDGDLVVFGDVDEIPRPWVLQALRVCKGYDSKKVRLHMRFTYYAYSVRHTSITWTAPLVTRYDSGADYGRAAHLRGSEYGADSGSVRDAGWHCSSCFRTYDQFVSKIRGFSHVEYGSDPRYYSREHIRSVVRNSLDLFDRPDQTYAFEEVGDTDAPLEVLMHKDRYSWLLDRRSPTAAIEGIL